MLRQYIAIGVSQLPRFGATQEIEINKYMKGTRAERIHESIKYNHNSESCPHPLTSFHTHRYKDIDYKKTFHPTELREKRKDTTKTVWFDYCTLQVKAVLTSTIKNYMRDFLNDKSTTGKLQSFWYYNYNFNKMQKRN